MPRLKTAQCSICSRPMDPQQLGPTPTCRECRKTGIRRNSRKTNGRIGCQEPRWPACWTCGSSMNKRAGARYCSRPCEPSSVEQFDRSKQVVECGWCGKTTAHQPRPDRGVTPACSRFCQSAVQQHKLGNTASTWPTMSLCSECLTPYPTKKKGSGHRCPTCLDHFWAAQRLSPAPLIRFVSCQCRRCGCWWLGDRLAGSNRETYCSDRCGSADARDRRRARQRSAFVAPVSRFEVFSRDAYRCHICWKQTDPSKVVPHPRAPTIDHVIPLARGGTHEPANVATACFRCNSLKGDRGGGEQLALLG